MIVYLGFVLAPLAWFYIYRTRAGLELRAIGEYPAAADVQGISVYRQRYFYVFVGGLLAGWQAQHSVWRSHHCGWMG